MELKEKAKEFLKLCADGNPREAFSRFASASIVHHNAYFPGDIESLQKGMEESEAESPDKEFEMLRSAEDGDLVFIHSKVRMSPSEADISVVHIMRFENEKIVEFWDVIQPAPEEMVNENGMF